MAPPQGKKKKSFGEKARSNMHGFCTFLYNKQTGQVMGRDGKSWAKIGAFYVIYYSCLAGFFAAMMAIFMQMLDKPGEGGPKLTQYLDSTPGLSVTPGREIKWTDGSNKSYSAHITAMNKVLKALDTKDYSPTDCPESDKAYSGKVPCRFPFALLKNCSGSHGSDPSFGFKTNSPCALVSINRVFDWVPKNYGSAFLTLKCSVKEGDASVSVMPKGFLISAFPYKGQDFYRTPPVAVQVSFTKKGKARVRCYLSGEGIKTADFFDLSRGYSNVEIEFSY